MTLAEKFYRKWFEKKLQPGQKLVTEDYRVIRMLHACLQENNKPKLPHGTIVVERNALASHLNTIQRFIDTMDAIIKEPSTEQRGRKIAHACNALQGSVQSIKHYQLNIPLDARINEELIFEEEKETLK